MHEWRHCESCDAALTDGLKGRIGPFFTSGGGTHRPNAATDLMAAKSPIYLMVSVRFPRSDDVMECLLDVHHRKWTS
jgi:hypothetical protein